jgi:hypothetical protein
MAGEYTRELFVIIGAAQRRISAMGSGKEGPALFGMLRQLISETGARKQILKRGGSKNISTDRSAGHPDTARGIDETPDREENEATARRQCGPGSWAIVGSFAFKSRQARNDFNLLRSHHHLQIALWS